MSVANEDAIELLPDGTIISSDCASEIKTQRLSDFFFKLSPKKEIVWGENITHIFEDTESAANSTRIKRRRTSMIPGLMKIALVLAVICAAIALAIVLSDGDDSAKDPSVAGASAAENNDNNHQNQMTITVGGDDDKDEVADKKNNKSKDECGYGDDNIFRKSSVGPVYVTIRGLENELTDEESEVYLSAFQESYNSVAGCSEYFQRRCDSVSLSSQSTVFNRLETEITCDVSYKCLSDGTCPDPDDPLFGSGDDSNPPQRRVAFQKKDRIRGRPSSKKRNLAPTVMIDGAEVFAQFQTSLSDALWVESEDAPFLTKMYSGASKTLQYDTTPIINNSWRPKISHQISPQNPPPWESP
mmetsp:Transcript_26534/g.40691  ORF Transcript_26534/g.40691 Transcript_26534/m.40691 type:complete len:357 (-) Transcript_26534:478-1548(-)